MPKKAQAKRLLQLESPQTSNTNRYLALRNTSKNEESSYTIIHQSILLPQQRRPRAHYGTHRPLRKITQ